MDNVVEDEIARICGVDSRSEHEHKVTGDIIVWMLNTPIELFGMDMKDVIKLFWNERLN